VIKREYLITTSIAIAVALMLVPSTQASIGLPDYDSDWVSIGTGDTIFSHNLQSTDVLVYVLAKDNQGLIHHNGYGGYDSKGAFWFNLTDNSVIIHRNSLDGEWVSVRVMIWKIEAQPQGVGGFWLPVDKFSLLAPYIISAMTIILVVSISVAYIKYRKKQ